MKTLAVFDPAISCFDPVLVQFSADLKWIEKYGVKVSRHNLGKEPQAFDANPAVLKEMEAGMDGSTTRDPDRWPHCLNRHVSLSPTTGTGTRHCSDPRGTLTRQGSGMLLQALAQLKPDMR